MKNIHNHPISEIRDSVSRIKEHGKTSSYDKGCRCDLCKKSKSDFRKNCPVKEHGKKWSYDKGCRCEECKKAKSFYWHSRHPNTKKPDTTRIEEGTRLCNKCHERKPLEEFGRHAKRLLGKAYECRLCHNKRGKENKNKPSQRFSTYKSSARVRGIQFHLSFNQFMKFWHLPCHYCGEEIKGIGLDRNDPKEGYYVGNVLPCCGMCNRAKTIQTTDQFISMCIKVAERFKNRITDLS